MGVLFAAQKMYLFQPQNPNCPKHPSPFLLTIGLAFNHKNPKLLAHLDPWIGSAQTILWAAILIVKENLSTSTANPKL